MISFYIANSWFLKLPQSESSSYKKLVNLIIGITIARKDSSISTIISNSVHLAEFVCKEISKNVPRDDNIREVFLKGNLLYQAINNIEIT